MAIKKVMFVTDDAEHARLRIQLKYDGLFQTQFFNMIIGSYVERDPDFIAYIDKKVEQKRRKIFSKKAKKQEKIEKQIEEDFGLNEEEIKNIFDLIAEEDPDI